MAPLPVGNALLNTSSNSIMGVTFPPVMLLRRLTRSSRQKKSSEEA